MSSGGRPSPAPPWPAMLLTAGLGTRLRPLTRLAAKPALPVAGQPLAGRILRWLSAAGVTDVVLNLHHRPASITAAIGDGARFGVRARYSWEPRLLGSAGGPAHALPIIGAPRFFLVNGDTLTDLDLAALAAAHQASGALVTMALIPNPDPTRYGGVTVDADSRVTGFTAKGPGNSGLHFIGVQVVEASVFAALERNASLQTVGGIYTDLLARHPDSIRAFVSHASFRDIGTAADYLKTCIDIACAEGRDDVVVEPGAAVAERAALARCVLWPDARVASDVTLDSCIVAGGAAVPSGSRFSMCVVRPMAELDDRDPFEASVGALLVASFDTSRPGGARTNR